jgi:hypothetical protein
MDTVSCSVLAAMVEAASLCRLADCSICCTERLSWRDDSSNTSALRRESCMASRRAVCILPIATISLPTSSWLDGGRTTQIAAGNAAGSCYRVVQPAGNAPRHKQR